MRLNSCVFVVNLTLSVMKGTLFLWFNIYFVESSYSGSQNRPQHLVQKEYNELGETASLMLRMCKPIFISGKSVVLGSEFFVAKGITDLKQKVCMWKL